MVVKSAAAKRKTVYALEDVINAWRFTGTVKGRPIANEKKDAQEVKRVEKRGFISIPGGCSFFDGFFTGLRFVFPIWCWGEFTV
jgi:hypothetical protein